ncbi:hypothetical protein [Cellulomonas sp. APG4]|nr:hypothetical protein [Cellulomonas sp. APG4]
MSTLTVLLVLASLVALVTLGAAVARTVRGDGLGHRPGPRSHHEHLGLSD